ncbi:MAG: cryptochrome/photolyase family protein [Hyphomicrobium sp.]
MSEAPIIVWLRNDLRLADHPALHAAVASGAPMLPVYILDDAADGAWPRGAASRWWLHGSLTALGADIEKLGAKLILRRGETFAHLAAIAAECGARTVHCSRGYEPRQIALETSLKAALASKGIELKRFAGRLLREPEDIRTKDGNPYKVYTPYWKALSSGWSPAQPLPRPRAIQPPLTPTASDSLSSWGLLPKKPDWAGGMRAAWKPGEAGAAARLASFLKAAVADYAETRNRPDMPGTSRLSPHLHFGEISPRRCWHAAVTAAADNPAHDKGTETFLKELVWREFSTNLLVHWPDLPEVPFRPEFAAFPWAKDTKRLALWQKGLTGYPIVDAGMRELWETGWMHNRVRMIVASFLIKDLLIPWQQGEAWFWDTLVDADLANNAASWQWVAGSGADAAPYFRIFNPITQGEKFDPEGAYVRRFVPELKRLASEHIHAPWLAPASALSKAGIVLGKTYPLPIVDHAVARERALEGYKSLKAG